MALAVKQEFGDDDEALSRRIRDDDRLLDMLPSALDGARKTVWEAKRIAIGRALGRAMADAALIDENAAFVEALTVLDVPHFRVMKELTQSLRHGECSIQEPLRSRIFAQLEAQGVGGVIQGLLGGGSHSYVTQFGHRLLKWVGEVPDTGQAASD